MGLLRKATSISTLGAVKYRNNGETEARKAAGVTTWTERAANASEEAAKQLAAKRAAAIAALPPEEQEIARAAHKKTDTRNTWIAGAVLVAIVGALVWRGAGFGGNDTGSQGASSESFTGSAACQHARNVATDINLGVLTTDEALRKLREVRNDAAADPYLYAAATRMLSAAISDNAALALVSATAFEGRCVELGH